MFHIHEFGITLQIYDEHLQIEGNKELKKKKEKDRGTYPVNFMFGLLFENNRLINSSSICDHATQAFVITASLDNSTNIVIIHFPISVLQSAPRRSC